MSPLRDAVLSHRDARLKPVTGDGIPEGLFVGKLTVAQADGLRALTDKPNASAWLFVALARDAEGNAPFTEKDVPALAEKAADMVGAAVKVGLAFNGMGDDADTEKN